MGSKRAVAAAAALAYVALGAAVHVVRRRRRGVPGGVGEAAAESGEGEVAGEGAGELEGGRGRGGEDGGIRVRRDAGEVAARGHRLRDQPLHAHPGDHRTRSCSSCIAASTLFFFFCSVTIGGNAASTYCS